VTNVYQAVMSLRVEAWMTERIDTIIRAWQLPPDDHWVIGRFHQIAYYRKVFEENRWLGIPALQNPNDLWITQELIHEVKPDFVVEAGTGHGGSAVAWASFLAHVTPTGRVITIDIKDRITDARKLPIWRQRVDFLLGSSTAPEIVAEVTRRVRGKRVLVILDSDHRKDHVLAELRAYAPLVPVGGYVIVQDTNVNGNPVLPSHGPGPMEAVQEFVRSDTRFEIDRTRERLLFTLHPMGYLKRVN
jgi:cephalosporin hydroxylase